MSFEFRTFLENKIQSDVFDDISRVLSRFSIRASADQIGSIAEWRGPVAQSDEARSIALSEIESKKTHSRCNGVSIIVNDILNERKNRANKFRKVF